MPISKWTVPFLPLSVGSTDYLAMQIDGPPPEHFHNSWIQSGRASPLQPERAETAAPQRRAHSDELLLPRCQGANTHYTYTVCQLYMDVNNPSPRPASTAAQLALKQLNDTAHLAEAIYAVAHLVCMNVRQRKNARQ